MELLERGLAGGARSSRDGMEGFGIVREQREGLLGRPTEQAAVPLRNRWSPSSFSNM